MIGGGPDDVCPSSLDLRVDLIAVIDWDYSRTASTSGELGWRINEVAVLLDLRLVGLVFVVQLFVSNEHWIPLSVHL